MRYEAQAIAALSSGNDARQGEAGRACDAFAGRARFGSLDGVRFLSIMAVLVHHSPILTQWGPQARIFTRGYLGVDFFFVISGFLITTLLLRERARSGRISLAGFYRRRALRILPLYLLLITCVGGYYVLVKRAPGDAELWPFYYLFLSNFLTEHIPTLGPTWSLSVEEQYYLLWPCLVLLLPRRALLGCAVGYALFQVVVMTLWRDAGLRLGPLDLSFAHMSYGAILLGAGLALLLDRRQSFAVLWPVLGRRWACVWLAGLLTLELFVLPVDLAGAPQLLVHLTMAALLGSVVIRDDVVLASVLRWRPVARIGTVSYGIYLLHLLADHVATAVMGRAFGGIDGHLAIYLPIYWGLSWLLAEISFRFWERPFLALRHKPLGFVSRAAAR